MAQILKRLVIADEIQLLDWGESRAAGPWGKFRFSDKSILDALRPLDTATLKKTGHVFELLLLSVEETGSPDEPDKSRYGQEARALRLQFIGNPEVWAVLGDAQDQQRWCKDQPCHFHKDGQCSGDIVGAHVRAVEFGSGTGIKSTQPCCIPMCHYHHIERQHQSGWGSLGISLEQAKEEAVKYVIDWAWECLRETFHVKHMYEVPPATVREWAQANDLDQYLPNIFREDQQMVSATTA